VVVVAGGGAKLATAYFELIPSMQGSQKYIKNLVPTLGASGVAAGKAFTASFTKNTATIAAAGVKSLQADVSRASSAVTQSRLKELDATGKVRVAETQLTEVTKKYGAESSRTVASQEKLATAQRTVANLHSVLTANTAKLSAAQAALDKSTASNTSGFQRFKQSVAGVGASIGSSISDGMGTMISVVSGGIATAVGIVGAGALAITATVGAAFDAGFNRLTTIETAQAKLRALGHTSQDVAEIMKDANDAVLGTQYSLADAVTASAAAVAAGIQPGQDLTSYLKLQANAAALAGVQFSDLGLVMNQVQSQNKAYTQDLNQVASRGIPIFQSLAQVYGTTIDGIRNRLQDPSLGVDAAHFRQALELNVGNAADEIGKTTVGSFENMKAAFSRFGAVLIGPIFPIFKSLFSGVISGLDSFAKILKPIAEEYGPKLQAVIEPLAAKIGPAFASFFADLQKAATSPEGKKFLAEMGSALKDVGAALIKALPSMLKFTEESLKLVAAVSLLAAKAAPAWIHGAQQIMDFGSLVGKNLETVAKSITDGTFWKTVGDKFANGGKQIGDFFSTWWTNVVNGGAQRGWDQLIGKFNNGWSQLTSGTATWLVQLGGAFANGWNQITAAFANGWAQWQAAAANGWAQITGAFANGGAQIGSFAASAWASVTGAFANGANQIGTAARNAWNGVTSAFANGWSQITSFFANAGSWLYDAGSSIVNGLARGIRDAIGSAVSAIQSVVNEVSKYLPHSPAKLGPFSGKGWTLYSGQALVEGFAAGVSNRAGVARAATSSMMDAVARTGGAAVPIGSGRGGVAGGRGVYIDKIVAPDQDPRVSGRIMGRELDRVMAGEV